MTAIAALPFQAGGLSCFDPSDNTVIEITTNGTFNSSWATYALYIPTGTVSHATSPTWPAATTTDVRCDYFTELPFNSVSNQYMARFYNGATEVVRVMISGFAVGTIEIFTLQSGVLTSVGTFSIPTFSVLNTLNFKFVAGAGATDGVVQAYAAGTLRLNVPNLDHTGWATGTTGCSLWGGLLGGYWSQFIVDTTSTVGRFLKYATLNTAGANTGWTGAPTDIDEIPTKDSNFIFAASAGLISTYHNSGLSLGTNNVLSVGIGARARTQGAGPAHIQLATRSNGTNYFSSSIATSAAFAACFNSWIVDPATSIAWTAAAAAAAEEGVKSIA